MIEAKLLEGRFLTFQPPLMIHKPHPPYTFLVPASATAQHIQESDPVPQTGIKKIVPFSAPRVSTVAANNHPTKAHRTFIWLDYYPGHISECPLTHDVITGPMSGCPLFIYKQLHDNKRMAAHVGTVEPMITNAAAINTGVKASWNHYVQNNQFVFIKGFDPADAIANLVPGPIAGDGACRIWGLMTTDDRLWALAVYRRPTTPTNGYRIAKAVEVPSWSPHKCRNL